MANVSKWDDGVSTVDSLASTCVDAKSAFESLLEIKDADIFLTSLRSTLRKVDAGIDELEDLLNMAGSLQSTTLIPDFAEAMHEWIFLDLNDFLYHVSRNHSTGCKCFTQHIQSPYFQFGKFIHREEARQVVREMNGKPEIEVLREVITCVRGDEPSGHCGCNKGEHKCYLNMLRQAFWRLYRLLRLFRPTPTGTLE
ncbi:hypothetical protein VCV18_012580 [Metarhizium anisopliae]